jgi:Phage terminase, small subunit
MTIKQITFCKEYLTNNNNGTKAAIKAGYSKKSARNAAIRLLQHDKVKKYIALATKERFEELDIQADMIIKELASIAFDDIGNYIDFGTEQVEYFDKKANKIKKKKVNYVRLKDIKAIPSTKNIQEVSQNEKTGQIKVKLYSRVDALIKLGEYLQMFSQKEKPESNETALAKVVETIRAEAKKAETKSPEKDGD